LKAAAGSDSPGSTARASALSTLSAPVAALDLDHAWRTLRELWQRGWASDHAPKQRAIARNAFAKACESAEPGEIIEGARAWIAAADAPRFLPPLPQWLDAHGWEKPPPTKAKQFHPHVKSVRRDNLPRMNGRKVDVARVSLEVGGYVENEHGDMVHPEAGPFGSGLSWGFGQ
jgi:hypothetical protein